MSTSTETSETNKPLSTIKLSSNAICSYKEHFNNTYFLYQKIRFFQHIQQITRLRMCEYLCRFISNDKKIKKIEEHAALVSTIETCLSRMHEQTNRFIRSYQSSEKRKEMVDLDDFNIFITKELISIVAAWKQIFSTSVISKIQLILKSQNLQGYVKHIHYLPSIDIEIWAEAVKNKFQSTYVIPRKKTKASSIKNDGYCCNWL